MKTHNYPDPKIPRGWHRVKLGTRERRSDRFWAWRAKKWRDSKPFLLEVSRLSNFIIRKSP